MKLFVVNTQLDESQSSDAWQASVLYRLAEQVEKIVVLTTRVGKFTAPPNVVVEVIPPRPYGVSQRVGGSFLLNFKAFHLCRKHQIDAAFIHVNTGWAYRLYPTFKTLGIPIVTWHEHAKVHWDYHLAVRCSDRVVSGSIEGAGTTSEKLRVIGHAVDMKLFQPPGNRRLEAILSISRIAPAKRLEIIVDLIGELKKTGDSFPTHLIGNPLFPRDVLYKESIEKKIQDAGLDDLIKMPGLVTKPHLRPYYERAFLTINFSLTNSLDAAVIESLASGCPVLTSSPSFFSMLKDFPEFIARDLRPEALAEQVRHIYQNRNRYNPEELRKIVLKNHDLESYAQRLLPHIRECLV